MYVRVFWVTDFARSNKDDLQFKKEYYYKYLQVIDIYKAEF